MTMYHARTETYTRITEDGLGRERSFTYAKFPLPYSIRIILICPNDGTDQIMCDMQMSDLASFGSHVRYEAISHVWGRARDPGKPIMCDGMLVNITASLYNALLHFRTKPGGPERALCADSICIDQLNTREINHQVQLMHRIYRSASKSSPGWATQSRKL